MKKRFCLLLAAVLTLALMSVALSARADSETLRPGDTESQATVYAKVSSNYIPLTQYDVQITWGLKYNYAETVVDNGGGKTTKTATWTPVTEGGNDQNALKVENMMDDASIQYRVNFNTDYNDVKGDLAVKTAGSTEDAIPLTDTAGYRSLEGSEAEEVILTLTGTLPDAIVQASKESEQYTQVGRLTVQINTNS